MIRFKTDQRIVRFERIVHFRLRETDCSLETDYSLVRIETDLFLQQGPVSNFLRNAQWQFPVPTQISHRDLLAFVNSLETDISKV